MNTILQKYVNDIQRIDEKYINDLTDLFERISRFMEMSTRSLKNTPISVMQSLHKLTFYIGQISYECYFTHRLMPDAKFNFHLRFPNVYLEGLSHTETNNPHTPAKIKEELESLSQTHGVVSLIMGDFYPTFISTAREFADELKDIYHNFETQRDLLEKAAFEELKNHLIECQTTDPEIVSYFSKNYSIAITKMGRTNISYVESTNPAKVITEPQRDFYSKVARSLVNAELGPTFSRFNTITSTFEPGDSCSNIEINYD